MDKNNNWCPAELAGAFPSTMEVWGHVNGARNPMETVKLRSGNEMPMIGLGTWLLRGDECVEAVAKAIEIGYRHIDTAAAYENHAEIRKGIERSGLKREDLFITSKVWYDALHYDQVLAACDKALSELGTDYLDLYLIHWPNKHVPMEETFGALEKLHKDGKVRDIGVSNFTIAHIRRALEVSRVPISVNQVEYHVHLNQEDLLAECRKHGICITAYAPLARKAVLSEPALEEAASRHGKTPAQVALRWLVQKGIAAIPKASSEEHLRANFEIFDFELSPEEMKAIDEIPTRRRYIAPGWAEFDIA